MLKTEQGTSQLPHRCATNHIGLWAEENMKAAVHRRAAQVRETESGLPYLRSEKKAAAVADALISLPGMLEVRLDPSSRRLKVLFDSGQLNDELIVETIFRVDIRMATAEP